MKLRLFIVILGCCFTALLNAQDTTTTIHILESDYLVVGGEQKSWIINGVFQHENATMRCDSTFLDSDANTLEAYGNVFIRQDDTITVQADRLFYDGNTRLARLFDNITMSDGQAVLTTNYLTYDLNTREGTYHNGGKIVNQDDTLVSRRGYYLVNTKDAYFRENAVVNTPEAVIQSDTLHYNTGTKVANFYGPTTIEGEDDFIYAENGTYNTGTDQAHFQENAYYRSGNHLLKGNELYYDRQRNFGRAKYDVYIVDTVENIILRGELGEYNKATETAFVTDSARVIMIAKQDSSRADTIYMAADTLKTRLLPVPEIQRWIEASYQYDVLGNDVPVPDMLTPATIPDAADSLVAGLPDSLVAAVPDSPGATIPDSLIAAPRDSLLAVMPDSLASGLAPPSDDPAQRIDSLVTGRSDSLTSPLPDAAAAALPSDSLLAARRQLSSRADTLPESERPAPDRPAPEKKSYGLIGPPPLKPSDYLPPAVADSLTRALAAADSLDASPAFSLAGAKVDSARVLFAFNNVRVFKSDLQAISDSLVYTSLDSVMRCYKTPVVWSEGTQMSAEFMTITLRNQQIDQLRMYRSAMIISQSETDSIGYNQMSGKEMTGVFEEGALARLIVEGNARTIYYVPEDSLRTMGINYAENARTILYFEENKLERVELLKDAEQTTYPFGDPEAITRLEGFHWRVNERPKNKDDIFRVVEPTEPPPLPEGQGAPSLRPGSAPLQPVNTIPAASSSQGSRGNPAPGATRSTSVR